MKNSFLLSLLLCSFCGHSQTRVHDTVINGKPLQIFTNVEQMPYPDYEYSKYLSENLHYPDSARVHNIEGRVIVKFVVKENGHISDCEITNSVNSYLDEEALRVIRKMPRWEPGRQNGKRVSVYFSAPIVFRLED